MGPGVITSRTLAFMTYFLHPPRRGSVDPVPRRYQKDPALNEYPRVGSGPAEQAVERAADLIGQGRGVGTTGSPGGDQGDGLGLTYQAAVQALDLAQPPDQVSAAALGAALKLGGPVGRLLAGRADEHELVVHHPASPGTLPPLRVHLPHAAAVTRHCVSPGCPLPVPPAPAGIA